MNDKQSTPKSCIFVADILKKVALAIVLVIGKLASFK